MFVFLINVVTQSVNEARQWHGVQHDIWQFHADCHLLDSKVKR